MARSDVVWACDNDDDVWFLDHASNWLEYRDASNATLEQLADFCDQHSESMNYHDFVGVHRWLAVALYRNRGRESATEIMRLIAEYGGLGDINGDAEAFKDMGIKTPWHEWKITDEG